MTELLALEEIARRVLQVRGQKVLLDADLAMLYGVETRRLNEQVKRNPERFPEDFMFQLTEEEWEALRSQNAILKLGRGQHRKYLPYVFTEHGASMAANVLSSARAVVVSIYIVRAFIALREALATNRELAQQFKELSHKVESHDQAIAGLIHTLRELMRSPEPQPKPIGFVLPQEKPKKDR